MPDDDYTSYVTKLVNEAVEKLKVAGKLMVEHGDEARAMDIHEAIEYAEGAIMEVD